MKLALALALALAAAKADDCNPNDRVCPECVPEKGLYITLVPPSAAPLKTRLFRLFRP